MLEHIHVLDKQINTLKKVLNAAGISCPEPPVPDLDDCEITDSYNQDKNENNESSS
jgi:serine O-acetyltransferase